MGRRNKVMRLEDFMNDQLKNGQGRPWKEQRDEAVAEIVESKRLRVTGKTHNQGLYIKAIETSTVTICVGPAGTGKTWMACGLAAEMLRCGRVRRIVVTRPLQNCDEDPGFLPGDLMEKVGPIMRPMMDAFGEFFSAAEIREYMADGRLEIIPLAYMRGLTLKDAFVLLDEAENATFKQLRMFLTRFGLNSRVVINGDQTQSDLGGQGEDVPLTKVIRCFSHRADFNQKPISIVRMGPEDIVRHPFIQWIDESLTGQFAESPRQKSTGCEDWQFIRCPDCQTVLSYDPEAVDKGPANGMIRCWYCHESIEVFDETGPCKPRIAEPNDTDQPYETSLV